MVFPGPVAQLTNASWRAPEAVRRASPSRRTGPMGSTGCTPPKRTGSKVANKELSDWGRSLSVNVSALGPSS